MKNKFIFFLILVALVAISCKNDDKNAAAPIKPEDTIVQSESAAPKDTQRVWKVSIGLLPDTEYQGNGIKAREIRPGKEAERAGLKAGDIVVELDGRVIRALTDYTMYLADFKSGETVEMTIIRDNQTIKKKLTFD